MATAEKQTAIAMSPIVDSVSKQIAAFQNEGRLQLPPNYSAHNALMSAWLKLQATTDRNGRPALDVCTKTSVTNALLDMVIQGLTPAKNQCYFIVYGNQLVCQRSYFGTQTVTKRVLKCQDIFAEVIYEGDEFEYVIEGGNKRVINHTQRLGNINKAKIVGAYCTIVMPDGKTYSDVMTIDEIHQAWSKSKMSPFDDKGNLKPNSTHGQFTADMAKKTAINHTCKQFINTSDDSSLDLVIEAMNRSEEAAEEAAFSQEVAGNANKEFIDADFTVKDEEFVDTDDEEAAEGETAHEEPVDEKKPAKVETPTVRLAKRERGF